MKKIKILISFDHELSLGGTNSYSRNLFGPTDQVIKTANDIDVPITLFTDVLCAIRFKEWDGKLFFQVYREQIRRTIQEGHDVQLHLHPHWIDSKYLNGKIIPSTNFALGDFHNRVWPNNIPGIINRGVEFLNELCTEEFPNYKCIAYRAGGYNLSPETSTILSSLYDNGIRIESSIAKGYFFKSKISEVNFRRMPEKANWFIPLTGPVNRESLSGLFEIPIATSPRNPINNISFLLKRVIWKNRRYQSGGWGLHERRNTSFFQKIGRLIPQSAWCLSFDNYAHSVKDLIRILVYHIQKHSNNDEIICCTISHPKSMGEYNRFLMTEFVERLRCIFKNQVEFSTFRQIYDELELK